MNSDKVKQIVSEAFDVEPNHRDAFVRKACGTDDSLLAEALSLLDAASHAELEGFLASTQRGNSGPTIRPDSASAGPSADPHARQQFGRYKVLELIGEGGMGIVYRAEQRVPMRREVVVKVIKLGMDTKLVIARFEAERQALAMMDHPHIAKVYDAGTDGSGRPYFVMEYVKGTPILDYCDRNHLSIKERLELFTQVCQAIQHAHHKGIIHRDIKPTNILVSTQDGKPFAKVIDFGIAKATNQRLTDRTLFTEHVNMIGTPAYMSPEQADGNIDIDTRTDVYSLGVVLYELLTGHTPFDARRLKSVAMNEIARIIREEDPPKPSTRISTMSNRAAAAAFDAGEPGPAPTEGTLATLAKSRSATTDGYVKSLRGEVDWIVMKALEKDRARRYETPNAISEDIRRYLNGMAIIAAPPSWQYRARKFVRKYKTSLIAGGMLTLLLILGLAGTAAGLIKARRSLVREQEATARESAAREDALLQAYIANIGAAEVAMKGESWAEARQRLQDCPPSKRGWEWQYLQVMASAPDFGFAEPVWRCQLSANDRLLLCQNNLDFQILDLKLRRRIWSYQTRNVQYTLANSISYPSTPSCDIAPDGSVAIESEDSVVLFGPGGENQSILKFEKADRADHSVKFSPSGKYLIVNRGSKTSLVNTAENKVACEFASVVQINWAPGEEVVALTAGTATVSIYDIRANKELRRLGAGSFLEKSEVASTAAFSPDGGALAAGSTIGSIWVFDLATGKPSVFLSDGAGVGVERLQFSPDGKSLLAVDSKKASTVWDVASKKSCRIAGYNVSNEARFSSDGAAVLDPSARIIWDWKSGSERTSVRTPAKYNDVRAFSQDGKMFISVDDYRVHVWRADHPNLQSVRFGFDTAAKNKSLLCDSFYGRDIYLSEWYEPSIDTHLVLFDKPATAIGEDTVVTSPDHRWSATPAGEHSVEVRNNLTMEHVATLANHEGKVRCITFTHDGSRIVTGSDDCTIRFWDTGTWREVAALRRSAAVTAMAFADDESRLIVGHVDKTIESLDIRDADRRKREFDAEFAETKQQQSYVLSLLNGTAPWDSLAQIVVTNTSMSPLSRIAALDVMHEQLDKLDEQAAVTLEKLKASHLLKKQMQDALATMDLPRANKKAAERLLADWKPDPKDLRKATWEVLATPGQSPDRYVTAAAAADQVALDLPEDHATIIELAAAKYRTGKFQDAIDQLEKAKAIGKDKNKLGPNGAVVSRPSFAELNNDDTLLAMAQFSLGMSAEARASLNRAVRGFGIIGDRRLVCEAAGMISPATTQPVARPALADFDKVANAIDAQRLPDLEAQVGQTITVKGIVERAVPTYSAGHLNIYLQPSGIGVMLWVRHDFLNNFDAAFFDDIVTNKVAVTGTLAHYTQSTGSWHGDLEIEIDNPSQITFFDRNTPVISPFAFALFRPHPTSAPAAPALVDVDANDLQTLTNLEDSDARVHGTVISARLTAAQNSLILNIGSAKRGFTVYIPPQIFTDLDARFDGRSVDALNGHEVIVTGTIVDYQGAPEIKLTKASYLQLAQRDATSAPTTQAGR